MPKQARGCRETEATSLRVKHIEDALNFRTDLTMAERRSLRSRKNTANFRERRRQACNQKQFYEVEIDLVIQELKSRGYCAYPSKTLLKPPSLTETSNK